MWILDFQINQESAEEGARFKELDITSTEQRFIPPNFDSSIVWGIQSACSYSELGTTISHINPQSRRAVFLADFERDSEKKEDFHLKLKLSPLLHQDCSNSNQRAPDFCYLLLAEEE